jgi:hypothetical protein
MNDNKGYGKADCSTYSFPPWPLQLIAQLKQSGDATIFLQNEHLAE